MAEPTALSVAFAYGASDRTGLVEAGRIREGLGLVTPPAILDWGEAAWNPPPAFADYLGRDRWLEAAGEGVAVPERALAAEEAAYAARTAALAAEVAASLAAGGDGLTGGAGDESGVAAPSLAIPAWIRRLALRRVAREIAASYLTVSDAIHYIARGDEIRAFVTRALAEWAAAAPRPRIAIGLSLGGTILVDVLSELRASGQAPLVDLLVTVGAQAPLLEWCDALALPRSEGRGSATAGASRPGGRSEEPGLRPRPAASLAPSTRIEPFTPWLNIWNPDDLLSYQTRGAFDGPGIRDVAVSDPGAFPENHTSYFENPAVFAAIREAAGALR